MSWLSRVANAFRWPSVDRGLDDEAAFHLECRIDELVAAGLSPEEAEAQARRAFGNRLRLREQSRDVKLLPWLAECLQDTGQDLRVAIRCSAPLRSSRASRFCRWPSASVPTPRSFPSSTACCSARCRSLNQSVSSS